MSRAVAHVPTKSGSRYLHQLCKHWSHNLAVAFDERHGTVTFPLDMRGRVFPTRGVVTMDAGADALTVRVEGGSAEHVEGLKGAVARHLDRFAFREVPLAFDWMEEAIA